MPEIDYQKIFIKYQELKAKTQLVAHDMNSAREVQPVYIRPDDLLRREELKKELEGNLEFLTDAQLRGLYDDDDLMMQAIRVLAKRKK